MGTRERRRAAQPRPGIRRALSNQSVGIRASQEPSTTMGLGRKWQVSCAAAGLGEQRRGVKSDASSSWHLHRRTRGALFFGDFSFGRAKESHRDRSRPPAKRDAVVDPTLKPDPPRTERDEVGNRTPTPEAALRHETTANGPKVFPRMSIRRSFVRL